MKCIHCNSDTNLKTRNANGKRCGSCGHQFAFEPTTDTFRIADGAFLGVLHKVSAKDTLHFTERQLYFEFCRLLDAKAPKGCFGAAAGVAILLALGSAASAHALNLPGGKALPAIAGLFGLGALATLGRSKATPPRGGKPPKYVRISFADFQSRYLNHWIDVHGRPDTLVRPLGNARRADGSLAATMTSSPEFAAYSFDRALVVQSGEMAAMLVANRFHTENNCAILSADRRYPTGGTFDTVLQMLGRNPNLTVFALHDASPDGMQLPARLRGADWFPDPGVRLVALGLRPGDVRGTDYLLVKEAPVDLLPADLGAYLTDDDAAWLKEGNRGEVAFLRPAQLMKRLYSGFARAAQTADDGWTVGPGGFYYWYDPYPMFWYGGGGMYGGVDGASWDAGAPDSFG